MAMGLPAGTTSALCFHTAAWQQTLQTGLTPCAAPPPKGAGSVLNGELRNFTRDLSLHKEALPFLKTGLVLL